MFKWGNDVHYNTNELCIISDSPKEITQHPFPEQMKIIKEKERHVTCFLQ